MSNPFVLDIFNGDGVAVVLVLWLASNDNESRRYGSQNMSFYTIKGPQLAPKTCKAQVGIWKMSRGRRQANATTNYSLSLGSIAVVILHAHNFGVDHAIRLKAESDLIVVALARDNDIVCAARVVLIEIDIALELAGIGAVCGLRLNVRTVASQIDGVMCAFAWHDVMSRCRQRGGWVGKERSMAEINIEAYKSRSHVFLASPPEFGSWVDFGKFSVARSQGLAIDGSVYEIIEVSPVQVSKDWPICPFP